MSSWVYLEYGSLGLYFDTPAVSSTHLLVLLAIHNILKTCLRHFFIQTQFSDSLYHFQYFHVYLAIHLAAAIVGSQLLHCHVCRRTGVDVKAGKNIRRDSYGFERFSDYWTSPGEMRYSVFVVYIYICIVC